MASVLITEVGPRDGLQNLADPAGLEFRTWLVDELSLTGIQRIEAGSFVSAKAVPAMRDSDKLFTQISRHAQTCYMALVPNRRGAEAALAARAGRLAVFTAASQSFCQRNIGCSIEQSLQRFEPVFQLAQQAAVPVRGYISCVSGCPYEGSVPISRIAELAHQLVKLGADEICLADTTGVGNPLHTGELVHQVASRVSVERIALHMHDTFGTGLVNSWAGYQQGVRSFDSAIAGLGGCPFAPGAAGNLATEDLVHLLHAMGLNTGIDLDKLVQLSRQVCARLNLPQSSRVSRTTNRLPTHAAG